MSWLALLRYARRVPGVSPALLALLAVAILYAGLIEWQEPGTSDSAMAMILVLQMFAAAAGFAVPASRGYLDPFLVAAGSRVRAGLALFVTASAPGWGAWVAVGLIQLARSGGPAPAFQPAAVVALFVVSSLAWAATLPTRRWTAGLLWMVAMVAVVVSERALVLLRLPEMAPEEIRSHLLAATGSTLAVPVLIPELRWPWEGLALHGLCGLAALAAGLLYLHRKQLPLSEKD